MHQGQRFIAFTLGVENDTQCTQISQLFKSDLLIAHLVPNTVDMLRPTTDLWLHALSDQYRSEGIHDLSDQRFALGSSIIKLGGNLAVDVSMQETKRQVFHFPFELPNTQTIRQGRV